SPPQSTLSLYPTLFRSFLRLETPSLHPHFSGFPCIAFRPQTRSLSHPLSKSHGCRRSNGPHKNQTSASTLDFQSTDRNHSIHQLDRKSTRLNSSHVKIT